MSIEMDGRTLALEAVDLMSGTAREKLAERVPEDLRSEVLAALVALALEEPPQGPVAASVESEGVLVRPVMPWPELVDPARVVQALRDRIAIHLHLPEHAGVVVAAWITLTYCLEALPVAPILWVRSPTRGCGKSTLLDLVTLLAARSLKSENATLSALFRIAEQHRATLVLDELDQWLVGDRAGEITGLLNAGFSRGGRFLRSVGDNHDPKAFDVFGFRAVAGIGRTLHDTTRSRAYTITLERAPAGTRPLPLQVMHADAWADPLRRQLARLGEQVREVLAGRLADPDATDVPTHLDGRARDLWLPALALAAEIGGEFAAELQRACEFMTRRAADEEGDIGVMLLQDVRRFFAEQGRTSVQPAALLAWLCEQDGSPWGEFRRDKPLTARGLADLLKRFEIASTKPTRHEGSMGRWLHATMFADAWRRYCPAPEEAARHAPASLENARVTDVTLETDVTLSQTAAPLIRLEPAATPARDIGGGMGGAPGLEVLPASYWEQYDLSPADAA